MATFYRQPNEEIPQRTKSNTISWIIVQRRGWFRKIKKRSSRNLYYKRQSQCLVLRLLLLDMNTNYPKKIPLQGKSFWNLNEFSPICHNAYNKFTQTSHCIDLTKANSLPWLFSHHIEEILFVYLFISFCFYCGTHWHSKYSSLSPKSLSKALYFLYFKIFISWGTLRRIVRKLVTGIILCLKISSLHPNNLLYSYNIGKNKKMSKMRPSKIEYKCYKILFNKEAWHYLFKKDMIEFSLFLETETQYFYFLWFICYYIQDPYLKNMEDKVWTLRKPSKILNPASKLASHDMRQVILSQFFISKLIFKKIL